MSGGSHNYVYDRIEHQLVGQMYDKELDELMKDIATLAHDLEWYDSGDYSFDDYNATVRKFKEKWFKTTREERLRKYIDEALEQTKEDLLKMIGD